MRFLHRCIIDLLSESLLIVDLLCKRFLMFVRSCLFSDNSLVKFVSHNTVFYDRMRSTIGHNAQLCCERFSLRLADAAGSMSSIRAIDDLCRDKVDDDMTRNIQFIVELVKDTRQHAVYVQ